MNLLAGALPQFNHAMGLIATEAGVNSGPGGWMPEQRMTRDEALSKVGTSSQPPA